MYNNADLATLIDALNDLTSDGFLAYDLNIGQVYPSLTISLSPAQMAAYPFLNDSSYRSYIQLYNTGDFTPNIADFISAFQAGVQSSATSFYPDLNAANDMFVTFPTFLSALQSKQ